MNNYIIIDGYHFKTLDKTSKEILNIMLSSNQAICALDTNAVIYNNEGIIYPEDKIINFNNYIESNKLLSEEEKNHLKNIGQFYDTACNINDLDYSIYTVLKSIYIKYPNFENEFQIDINLIMYENNRFNYIFKINFDNSINPLEFQNTILNNNFEYIKVPKEYVLSYEEINDNYITITTPTTLNNYLHNMLSLLSEDLIFINQRRSSMFISNDNKIDNIDIHKILLHTTVDLKEYPPLKDFRITNEFYHYSNELMSIIIGNTSNDIINEIIILDLTIVNSLINDMMHINNIYDNNYSLKELLDIQDEYNINNSFKKHNTYVEENNYINYIFNLYNKYDVSNAITIAIEKKKLQKQEKKEFILSFLGCILSIPVIYEYIIEPFTIYIYNKINEDSICKIPSPYNFIIVISLIILSISIINIIIDRIDNRKRK